MGARKEKTGNTPERPKYNNVSVKCPYCDLVSVKKIKYSLTESAPNLITCSECKYNFLVIQSVEVKLTIIDLQDKIEDSIGVGHKRSIVGAELDNRP